MEHNKIIASSLLSFVLLFLSNVFVVLSSNNNGRLNTYIISVQPPEIDTTDTGLESWYRSFLPETVARSSESRMVHTYSEVFSGFAARFTEEEVEEIKKKKGFVQVYPDRHLSLHTTRTPEFLGLHSGSGLWNDAHMGKGVIIGVLDTGILPTHPSFGDDGMAPPPAKWNGTCDFETGCNNKLIGAKSFGIKKSPVDDNGHGSHTSSTAAGNFVPGASLFGMANGTASGMAPGAHLAMYQVCDNLGCPHSSILAGLDAAVKDGVDVLSLSFGGETRPYNQDPIAIGTFTAMQKGIIVVCSAGNSGPNYKTVSNEAPWILTVAASTTDRSLRSTVTLGDGQQIYGENLFHPSTSSITEKLPLYYPETSCYVTLDTKNVKGKVVLCEKERAFSDVSNIERLVKEAGAAGMILVADETVGYNIVDRMNVLPTSTVASVDGKKIVSYIKSKGVDATASITFDGTVLDVSPSPVVAFFSSRGPSSASPGLLKPDITGPGFNILAAWPDPIESANSGEKTFNIISGTFMSAPHLSGIAALVKAAHPDWSPAAIKSAIMTTSDIEDRYGKPILDHLHNQASFFDMGAGHVNVSKVADPGLVYDLDVQDYVAYLCGLLGESGMRSVVRQKNVSCSTVGSINEAQLNYPSILVSSASKTVVVNRTVTNVGDANSIYKAELDVPEEMNVDVEPKILEFSKVNDKRLFTVSVHCSINGGCSKGVQGNLRWVSENHIVRSPIVIPPTA